MLFSHFFLANTVALGQEVLAGDEKSRLLLHIQQVQEAITTLSAAFTEKRQLRGLNAPLTFSGKLYLNKKGLFFLKYEKPVQHILRVQNEEVLLYLSGSSTADMINLADMNTGTARPDFFQLKMEQFKGAVVESAEGYVLDDHSDPGRAIRVVLDKTSLLAKKISFTGESGDLTEIMLQGVTINKQLPREIVDFSLPKGTKIHRMTR